MRRPKVLFLDDEVDLLEMFRDYCDDIAEVRIFAKPQEALLSALSDPPEIAFLDYRLPTTTGVEVGQHFPPEARLYLLTGELDIECPTNFEKILIKPIRMSEIAELILKKSTV